MSIHKKYLRKISALVDIYLDSAIAVSRVMCFVSVVCCCKADLLSTTYFVEVFVCIMTLIALFSFVWRIRSSIILGEI